MAVGEKRNTGTISQVSWTDGTSQDVYYGQEHSFQYSSNINCDDELHGIKLSQEAVQVSSCAGCQLISSGEHGVFAIPHAGGDINLIYFENGVRKVKYVTTTASASSSLSVTPGVIFQDYLWRGVNSPTYGVLYKTPCTGAGGRDVLIPRDHPEATDESISDPDNVGDSMEGAITALLNYNNTRLVIATHAHRNQGTAIWVYYPELESLYNKSHPGHEETTGKVGWKKVMEFEAGVNIVALTCTFEYLKVRAVDEGWNTKVYYYQGNNNLRSTFVYNVVDLTGVRVTRVYSINGIDYYVSSQDGTDGYVNLYKMVGTTPVSLFHQRGGLDPLDVNYKAPYFVGPCGMDAGYVDGKFYIADSYGLFKFRYTPQGYDKGYMKRGLNTTTTQPYGVCFNQGYLYVSYSDKCYAMREYDTGKDGYQDTGVMISREYEGKEGGTLTKMLDEIRLNYELNPLAGNNTGTIDIYVSPNNLWKSTSVFTEANGWYHAMHIDKDNKKTRTEKSNLFNNLSGTNNDPKSSFAKMGDWQTITYAIVINQNTSTHATPIVRQIDVRYHTKDKVNNVYDIN